MKLSDLYQKAVEVGIRNDPRDDSLPQEILRRNNELYNKLEGTDKEYFDMESLWNPYLDSRIVCDTNSEADFRKAVVALDIGNGEIRIASEIGADLLISHHPEGKAYAGLWTVLDMQVGILEKSGVDTRAIASSASEYSIRRQYELAERDSREESKGEITEHLPDLARHYRLSWIALHTIADNFATTFLQNMIAEKRPYSLADLLDMLMEVPEYRHSMKELIGPRIVAGTRSRKVGKIIVDMTGGGEGPEEIFYSIPEAGINTVLCMHASEDWYKEAEKHHISVVCAGHAPSDSLGMNLLLDEVMPDYVELYPLGGFRRFSHKEKTANGQESVQGANNQNGHETGQNAEN